MKKQFARQSTQQQAFTMIELLVVTTIIIVLTAIGIVSFRHASRSARNGRRKADLETVRQGLMLYKSENGCYPVVSPFSDMKATIEPYMGEAGIVDPKNNATYFYSYVPSGSCGGGAEAADFTLQARLEDEATPTVYEVSSP
ncbi:MAG: prepilin-type N-terminal cleavage/methylation domain-containing protein [Patescibacteria group bacterium]|nr:prepilin-type N-terminal cleavage/methylation domain-containing protein [Patescibacteria group bacterium]